MAESSRDAGQNRGQSGQHFGDQSSHAHRRAGIVALLGFPTLWRRRRRKRQGLPTDAKGVVDYSCEAPPASLIFNMTAAPARH